MENNWNEPRVALPNASVVLVLGIISIVGCCCTYGTVGIVCGIIALVLAKSANDLYVSDTQRYTASSYQNMKAGRICAWIGLIPSILSLVFLIYMVSILGFAMFTDPSVIYDHFGLPYPF